MKTIFDNVNTIERADDRIILEEDANGHLYETNNASMRALVCSAMFFSPPKREDLIGLFGSEEIAERYLNAVNDFDK